MHQTRRRNKVNFWRKNENTCLMLEQGVLLNKKPSRQGTGLTAPKGKFNQLFEEADAKQKID